MPDSRHTLKKRRKHKCLRRFLLGGKNMTTEAEGLEPPKACARRISSAVPYQLDYAS
jgi:hypothetical protein